MKKKLFIYILLITATLFCPEQKETNSKSPWSRYQQFKGLKTQGKKIIVARNSYTIAQATFTALLVATSYRVPPARILAKSAAINYAYYKLTK
jgi:hypothetical protein